MYSTVLLFFIFSWNFVNMPWPCSSTFSTVSHVSSFPKISSKTSNSSNFSPFHGFWPLFIYIHYFVSFFISFIFLLRNSDVSWFSFFISFDRFHQDAPFFAFFQHLENFYKPQFIIEIHFLHLFWLLLIVFNTITYFSSSF